MWPGFEIGGFTISSFGLMMFTAFVSCNFLIKKTLKEKNINIQIGDSIIFWAALGGIIGAKLYYTDFFPVEEVKSNTWEGLS